MPGVATHIFPRPVSFQNFWALYDSLALLRVTYGSLEFPKGFLGFLLVP